MWVKVGCGFSDRFEYEYEYRCTEYEYEYDRDPAFLKILGLKLVAGVVLVLSIAVLVLDSILRYSGGSWDQSCQL